MESDGNWATHREGKGLFVVASRSRQARGALNATFLEILVIRAGASIASISDQQNAINRQIGRIVASRMQHSLLILLILLIRSFGRGLICK